MWNKELLSFYNENASKPRSSPRLHVYSGTDVYDIPEDIWLKIKVSFNLSRSFESGNTALEWIKSYEI